MVWNQLFSTALSFYSFLTNCELTKVLCALWQQEDSWHDRVSDVCSQLRFLEEIEKLKKKRRDEEEKEKLLRLARVR